MAKERGWWDLDCGETELSDADREHIASEIIKGCTSGEIAGDEDILLEGE